MTQPVNLDAAVERAIHEWLRPYEQEYRPPHDRLRNLVVEAALSASNARAATPCEECKGTGNKHCRPIAAGDKNKYDLCPKCEGTGRVASPCTCARAEAAEETVAAAFAAVNPGMFADEDEDEDARTTLASMREEGRD